MVGTSPRSGPIVGAPQAEHRKQHHEEHAMRSYLSPGERREYLMRAAELGALEEDIESARAAARRATAGFGLDLRARHEPAHAVMQGEHVRLADGGEIVVRPIEPGDAHDLAVGIQHLSAL